MSTFAVYPQRIIDMYGNNLTAFSLLSLTLCVTLTSCEKDDKNEPINRIKVIDETILDDDVNAPRYWDDAELVWSDEFNGSSLSSDNWVFEQNSVGGDATEWQNYVNDNAEVNGGNLNIIAKKVGTGQKKGDYTSSRISSKYAFGYGRFEVRAKLPNGEKNGVWAKLAMVGDNINEVEWPNSGEINLMEYLSFSPNDIFVTVHSEANNERKGTLISSVTELETAEEEFHVYGLLWTDRYLKFYIDDIDNITYVFNRPNNFNDNNWPFMKPFYFITGMAVGGANAGAEGVDDSIFPATMEIDYIRVYHAK